MRAPRSGTWFGRAFPLDRLPAIGVACTYVVLLLGLPSQLVLGPLGSPGTPANLVGVGALIWWVCATLGGLNPVRGLTTTRVLAAFLALMALMSYAAGSMAPRTAPAHLRFGIADWTLVAPTVAEITQVMSTAADRGLVAAAGWIGILLLVGDGLRDWADLDKLVAWLTWSAAVVAALGILQYATRVDLAGYIVVPGLTANSEFGAVTARSVVNRVSSTAVHPIEYGVVLATLFPFVLHWTTKAWGHHRLAWLPTLLVGAGMFLSVSRSTVVSIAAAGVVLLIGFPAAWRRRSLWLVPLGVVALRLAFPGLLGTIYALFVNVDVDPSIEGRTNDYVAVEALWAEHPLLGRGLFTFVPQYFRILDNQYLLLLMEVGIIGLVLFGLTLLTGFGAAVAAHRRAVTRDQRHVALAAAAGIAAVAVSCAVFDTLVFPMATGCLFLVLGVAGASWRLASADRPVDPRLDDLVPLPAAAGAPGPIGDAR